MQFFADLGEALPDVPIMIYANPMFFKSTFPTPFWEGIARRAPTVITCKGTYDVKQLPADIAVAGHQINFMPGQNARLSSLQGAQDPPRGVLVNLGRLGPEPLVALMDAVHQDDQQRVDAIWEDVQSVPSMIPPGEFSHFPDYNAQVEKARFNAAGYIKAGPSRAPYRDLPDHWRQAAEKHEKGWAELLLGHEAGPVRIERALVGVALPGTDPAGEVVVGPFVAQPHLIVERHPAGSRPASRYRHLVPVVAIVLLQHAAGAEA